MHKVFLIGNLTRDPELTEVGADGTKVCKFSLAVNRQSGTEKVADFYNISLYFILFDTFCNFYYNHMYENSGRRKVVRLQLVATFKFVIMKTRKVINVLRLK